MQDTRARKRKMAYVSRPVERKIAEINCTLCGPSNLLWVFVDGKDVTVFCAECIAELAYFDMVEEEYT